jgi:uncharacterized protein (DUF927 family)
VGRFLLYAGFAGLILEPLGRRPFIIHLHGDTSTSKTTALRLVASIFGQPLEGKGMIKWANTMAFLTRYMEKLKNIPLVIDESSMETKNIFESIIYMMEAGMSKGKALKSDPLGTAPIRTFRCAVFSSGEPPVVKEENLSGAQIRVIEFDSCPWGSELPRKQYEAWTAKIMANYGHAAEAFIEAYLRIKDDIDWNETHPGDDKLTSIENRVKKIVNLVQVCGKVVNELFDLGFDVNQDCAKAFEIIKDQLQGKQKTAERIMEYIHDFYVENQVNFLETKTEEFTGKITAPTPKAGKVFGYIFGQDLGILKSVFKDAMEKKLNQPNGGGYALKRLKKSGDISEYRHGKQVNGRREYYVYFCNFFTQEEAF